MKLTGYGEDDKTATRSQQKEVRSELLKQPGEQTASVRCHLALFREPATTAEGRFPKEATQRRVQRHLQLTGQPGGRVRVPPQLTASLE